MPEAQIIELKVVLLFDVDRIYFIVNSNWYR